MPLGHLMLGLFGGVMAAAIAMASGLPIGMAALLFFGVGNLVPVCSLLLQAWLDHNRRPPRRPAHLRQRPAHLRAIHLPH